MCHLPDKWTDKKIFSNTFVFLCVSIMVVGVVSPILIYFSVKEPISNKAWKQVYTNNENASVEISFEEGCYQKNILSKLVKIQVTIFESYIISSIAIQ